MKSIRLFCFPYAGGSAEVYSKWKMYLDNRIDLLPIEIAGRGKRIKEPFYINMSGAIDDVYNVVSPYLKEGNYSFFGHSMGTIFVHELCQKIIENGDKPPAHIFVSGRYPPHIQKSKEKLSQLPNEEFIKEILKIGGTNKKVFENKELLDLFIPILKADYRLVEDYEYIQRDSKYSCNVTVFTGKADKGIAPGDMNEWKIHTIGSCKTYEYDGGHFFIHKHTKEVTKIINDTLLTCLSS